MNQAILLMAHGAPERAEDVEEYVLRIRHGRPLDPEKMAILQDRYRKIGGSPLLRHTCNQAAALQKKMNEHGLSQRVYFGMRYWHPFIGDTVREMKKDGVESILGICLAPQFSRATIGGYEKDLVDAMDPQPVPYRLVRSFGRHPLLISAFATRVKEALNKQPDSFVLFTAHSLPEKIVREGDGYDYEAKETACLVARAAGLADWRFAYQSQGMTAEPWLGPTVESVLDWMHSRNLPRALVCPVGFVADHLEILYDIDVYFKEYAAERGITLDRTPSLNDSPDFIDLLFSLIREQS